MRTIQNYTESFKKNAVKKLLMDGSAGVTEIASKLDIAPSTLFGWKKKYANQSIMKKTKNKTIDDWMPEQKLETLLKTANLGEHELGEYLRSNGLHSSDLEAIKTEFIAALPTKGRPKLDPEVVELRKQKKALQKDLKKKNIALAEYSARVILLKKSHVIWGDPEDEE